MGPETVVVGAGDRYRYTVQHRGKVVRIVDNYWDPVSIDPEHIAWSRDLLIASLRQTRYRPVDWDWDGAEIPSQQPAFTTLAATATGQVWVRRAGRSIRAKLSTEIGGRVVAIPLREGALASCGDLLLQLDDASQQARVELSRRELETIEAQREQARLAAAQAACELHRNQSLRERQIISENLLDRLQSTAETTAAACAAALVGIEAAARTVAWVGARPAR